MRRQRKFWAFAAFSVAAAFVLLFQNCGTGFQALDQASVASLSVPTLSLIGEAPAVTNANTVTLKFATSIDSRLGLQSLTCELDGGTEQDCKSLEFSMPSLTPGDHKVVIRLTDNRGQKLTIWSCFL